MREEKFIDIDLDASEGEWFPFQVSSIDPDTGKVIWDAPALDDKGEPIASLKIRIMAPFYEERIVKRVRIVEHVFNPKSRSMERISSFKDLTMDEIRAERDDAIDYAITDIKGFRDKSTKKPLECTKENKLALMKIPVIDRFFGRCQELLGQFSVEKRKEEAENFTNGSYGQINIDPE